MNKKFDIESFFLFVCCCCNTNCVPSSSVNACYYRKKQTSRIRMMMSFTETQAHETRDKDQDVFNLHHYHKRIPWSFCFYVVSYQETLLTLNKYQTPSHFVARCYESYRYCVANGTNGAKKSWDWELAHTKKVRRFTNVRHKSPTLESVTKKGD